MKRTVLFCLLNVFVILCVKAQTGPGGVGNKDGASGQPQTVLWLKSGTGVTTTGSLVDTWADQSGNANNAAGSSTTRPTLVTGDANFNNQASISFPATPSTTNYNLKIPDANNLDNTAAMTVFYVIRPTNITPTTAMVSKRTGVGANQSYVFFNNGSGALISRIEGTNIAAGTIANNTVYISSTVMTGTNVAPFVNGTAQTTGTGPATIANYASNLFIGTFDDSGGEDRNFEGNMSEVVIYLSSLNAAQRQIVENYLSAKFNVTISNDVYAGDAPGNGNYDFDVIGIGRQSSQLHTEANSGGFILSTYNGTVDTDGEFVLAGHNNTTNAVSTSNLGSGVVQRWAKAWYVDKTTAGTLDAAITFDFSEGISGQFPQTTNDYLLLKLNTVSGNYENVGIAAVDKSISGDRITFKVANATLVDGVYTLGTSNLASPVNGSANRTWYSYQTGNWEDPFAWTLDGAVTPLYVNPGGETPASSDNVVVTSGRTITITTDNKGAATIEVAGTLNVAATSGHNFTDISGRGRIRISGAAGVDNFPSGTTTLFADALTGGTVEIYGTGFVLNQNRTYNDLIINLTSGAASIAANYTLNGDLYVDNGTFRFNDGVSATVANLTIYQDLNVASGTTIDVANNNLRHQLNLYGNFTNSGTANFTRRTTTNYTAEATDGIVDFNILSTTQNQTITCNGITRFYRIKIAKGTDDTYTAAFAANAVGNFLLYGKANTDDGSTAQLTNSTNAFALLYGTAEIRANISIPVLSTTGNFNISAAATLWVNGGSVLKNQGNALVPYGKVRVSAGLLEAKVNSGITTRDNGSIVVDGATAVLNTNQIRTSILGPGNVGGYIQSAGAVTVDAGFSGGAQNDYYVFSLTYPGNVFNMSGGTLTVKGSRGGTDGTRGGIFINSDPANVNVTGGTVIADISNANFFRLTSRATFWNLELKNSQSTPVLTNVEIEGGESGDDGGLPTEITLAGQPLVVLGSLTINNYVNLDHNGLNVTIGANMNIATNGAYEYNATKKNTTIFDGDDDATLNFQNKFSTGAGDEQQFWNIRINKIGTATITLNSGKTDRTGNNNNLVRTNGTSFKLLSGKLDQGSHSLRMYCDSVINYGTLGVFLTNATNDNTPNDRNDLIKFRDDNLPTKLITNSSSLFGAVRLNSGDEAIDLISDVRMQFLQFNYGRIHLHSYNLKLDELRVSLGNEADSLGLKPQSFSVEDMFITDGNHSDKGLSIYIPAGTSNNSKFTFPIGIGVANDATNNPNGAVYTPALLNVKNVTSAGYITVNPVDGILQTTNLSGGSDILSYYWRVRYETFTTLPTVAWQFTYNDADIGGTEANYVPGRVLDASPFTRSADGNATDVIDNWNAIVFNGTPTNGSFPGGASGGFTLEAASYTAGATTRFTGTLRVFYTRTLDQDAWNRDWQDGNMWTLNPVDLPDDANSTVDSYELHDSRQPAAGTYPTTGDIAVIGWVPHADPNFVSLRGYPHGIAMNRTENVAEVRFTQMLTSGGAATARLYSSNFQFRPTVVLNNNGGGSVGQIGSGAKVSGEGMFWIRSTGGNLSDPPFTGVDMGSFNNQDSSYFVYESTLNSAIYTSLPTEFPNLMFATDNWGASDKESSVQKDITVKGNMELLGNINFILNTGANGNITIGKNLVLFRSNAKGNDSGGFGEIRFGNSGTARTITVGGDLVIGRDGTSGFIIRVGNPGATAVTHTINLYGNFKQFTSGTNGNVSPTGNGFKGGTSTAVARIHMNLLGSTSTTISKSSGDDPQFYSLTVNKGTSPATTATMNTSLTVTAPSNVATKPLTLLNGSLVLNNAGINLTLSSGNGSFSIPGTAGLTVQAGQANVTGDDIGILLDGTLKLSGTGTVTLGDGTGNGNNFIEYSASGNAIIDVSGTATLTVGSAIRRGLSSTDGILKYRQTSGTVVVGRRAAPTVTRGVFEVVNNGSEFTQSGGTLTLSRGINSTTVPSLLLTPQTPATSLHANSNIIIGDVNTPAGVNGQNIGIKASKVLSTFSISNAGGNSPRALLYASSLSVSGTFTIGSGTTFDAKGFGVGLGGNLVVNGTYLPSGNTTAFSTTATRTISGSGNIVFYNMTKANTGTTSLAKAIEVTKDLKVDGGVLQDNGFSITLRGNATFGTGSAVGTHTSTSGSGIIFAGTTQQELSSSTVTGASANTASLGIITVNNPAGVVLIDNADNITISTRLRLQQGVIDIGGALLTLAAVAEIEEVNTFSVTNMIKSNTSFTDKGVQKLFSAARTTNFTFPVGEAKYTPVLFVFSGGKTSGTSAGSITVRPSNERQVSVEDDPEDPLLGCSTQINDLNHVIQYYWEITAANITGMTTDIILKYDQSQVPIGSNEPAFLGARILDVDASVGKFAPVNAGTNEITFTLSSVGTTQISGQYFAGEDCAIPTNVPIYQTKGGGLGSGSVRSVGAGGIYVGDPVNPPAGAILRVAAGDVVTFEGSDDNTILYSSKIDGTVTIKSGSIGHRLGTVTGTGTLRFEVNSPQVSAVLPAGYYNDFFSCTNGGGLEFGGTANYEILGGIGQLRRLTLDGTGTRTLSNNDIVICEDLTVTGPSFSNVNNRNISVSRDLIVTSGSFSSGINNTLQVDRDININGGTFGGQTAGSKNLDGNLNVSSGTFSAGSGGTFTIKGNINYTGGTFTGGTGTHKFVFNGTSGQTTSGALSVNSLEINNATGLTFGGNVSLATQLLLTNGNISTGTTTFLLAGNASVVPDGGQVTSFVNGKMSKVMTSVGDDFLFPIGKGTLWRTAFVKDVTTAAHTWSAEWFNQNTITSPVTNLTPTNSSIVRISDKQFWKISDSGSNNAKIGLMWGDESNVSNNAVERQDLQVMAWNNTTSKWDNFGGTNFSSGHTKQRGTFESSSNVSFSERIITLGSTDLANPLPVEFVSFTGETIAGVNHLQWETAIERNSDYFVLEHSTDGEHFKEIGQIAAAGFSRELMRYSLSHELPSAGWNYYRLKEIDVDGDFMYADQIVSLHIDADGIVLDFSVFPNPTDRSETNLNISRGNVLPVKVRLMDLSGKTIISQEIESDAMMIESRLELDNSVQAGIYFVEVSQGQVRKIKRLVVKK